MSEVDGEEGVWMPILYQPVKRQQIVSRTLITGVVIAEILRNFQNCQKLENKFGAIF